ncbi:NADPH:quinone reductase [Thoreauomyces humboldtii]|nr:NADPH:quinone reductase [Thoreauomyces humboldtii]
MKGVQISKTGGTDVLEYRTDLPLPELRDGQVLVKNDFIGVNFIDTYFRTGLYKAPRLPYTLGREGGGHIVALGPGPHPPSLKVSSPVAYLSEGAYAEYSAVPSVHTFALPQSVDTKTGAASILQGLTAITLIRDAYNVKSGDWILVHAAAGGMGLWLCQLLKAVGAHVIGTASTAEKRALAQKNGAEVTLEYPATLGHQEFVAKVMSLTGGSGVAAVFDGVGKDTFDVSLDCCARKGTLASFGNASGAVPPLTIARLSAKNVRLMRPTLFNFIATREEFEGPAKELFDLVGTGKVAVAVHEVYDLKDVARAQSDLEARKTTGKLVMKV